MGTRHKVLLLDDDVDLLDMYRQLLTQLPSQPEIYTATSGPRAMAMLEAEPFRLLICDLRMPKMDGLQVLSIVRRKHPELRTVALTSVADEQFRSRAYALGVDLFWYKPATEQEIKMFLECLESLLGRESEDGFRGVQSKSLVDIIQLECISQSSSTLRITNGGHTGKIWIQDGEVIDAEAGDIVGEPAFHRILSWRAGGFESLPAEPSRPRTILKSYNGLLLETAQAIDEKRAVNGDGTAPPVPSAVPQLSQIEGIEFVLAMKPAQETPPMARGLENPERMAQWSRQTFERFRGLSDRIHAGPLVQFEGVGPQRNISLTTHAETEFCLGWKHSMTLDEVREMTKKIVTLWAS
jgi:two-component system OmpR family response regulator